MSNYKYEFKGECDDSEVGIYKGNDNPGKTFDEKVKNCARECTARKKKPFQGKWAGHQTKGFIVQPSGRCFCEDGNSKSCNKVKNGYKRYDFIKPFYKAFNGECSDTELGIYKGSDNPGKNSKERATFCAKECSARTKKLFKGKWKGHKTKGFIVNPSSGRCFCEDGNSKTCKKVKNNYVRFDYDEKKLKRMIKAKAAKAAKEKAKKAAAKAAKAKAAKAKAKKANAKAAKEAKEKAAKEKTAANAALLKKYQRKAAKTNTKATKTVLSADEIKKRIIKLYKKIANKSSISSKEKKFVINTTKKYCTHKNYVNDMTCNETQNIKQFLGLNYNEELSFEVRKFIANNILSDNKKELKMIKDFEDKQKQDKENEKKIEAERKKNEKLKLEEKKKIEKEEEEKRKNKIKELEKKKNKQPKKKDDDQYINTLIIRFIIGLVFLVIIFHLIKMFTGNKKNESEDFDF